MVPNPLYVQPDSHLPGQEERLLPRWIVAEGLQVASEYWVVVVEQE